MILLARDAAFLILVWCAGLTMTYGIVESILLLPVRIGLSALGVSGWWLETLVYCPICSGFWCFGVAGAVGYLDPWWFVKMASIGVASLLLARAWGADLVISRESVEEPAIENLREIRKSRTT